MIAAEKLKSAEGLRSHAATLRFSNSDLVEICKLLETPQFRYCSNKENDSAEARAPGPPSADLVELITPLAQAAADAARSPSAPWWCRPLCQHRSRCHGLALAKAEADPQHYYLMLFARQSPLQVNFLQLRPRPRVVDCSGDDLERVGDCVLSHMEFDYLPPVVLEEWQLDFAEDDDILCLQGVRFRGTYAACGHAPEFFERAVAMLPPLGTGREQSQHNRVQPPKVPTDLRDALLLQYHWLSASDFTRPRQHHPHRAVVVDNAELVAHEDGAEGAAAPLAVPLADVDGELVLYDDDAAREELAVIRADLSCG